MSTPKDRVIYVYFGRLPQTKGESCPDHNGVVTAAYRFLVHDEIEVAFAYCMPEDPFCKKKARKLTHARLTKGTGVRRRKGTGKHVPGRWYTHIAEGEQPLDTICRVFNELTDDLVPLTFQDWVLTSEDRSVRKQRGL